MERSLSILLPIYNRQATLRESVLRVLEVAADLTPQFDLLVVDNGSADATSEVAYDLRREFPQVLFHRFAVQQDLAAVVRVGLSRTHGEILCLHEGSGHINVADLRALWQLRHDELLVMARSGGTPAKFAATSLDRLLRGGAGPLAAGSGFHLLRRDSIELAQSGAQLRVDHQQVRLRRDLPQTDVPAAASRPNFMSRLRRMALGE